MRTSKGLYAFLAFGPLALMFISIFGIIGMAVSIEQGSRYMGRSEPPAFFFVFIGLIFLASIFSLVSMIMYIVHVTKNPNIQENNRIGWIIGMVLGGVIAQIIYFFLYITKEEELDRDRMSREEYLRNNNYGQQKSNPFD